MSTVSRKRQRAEALGDEMKREGLSVADYVETVFHSLGYDQVSSGVKEQFVRAIQKWIHAVSTSFTKDGKEYPLYHVVTV